MKGRVTSLIPMASIGSIPLAMIDVGYRDCETREIFKYCVVRRSFVWHPWCFGGDLRGDNNRGTSAIYVGNIDRFMLASHKDINVNEDRIFGTLIHFGDPKKCYSPWKKASSF